jgi:dUTP pyrophosphatase
LKNYIEILRKKSNAVLPKKATEGSAGFDLHACLETCRVLAPGDIFLTPTGISLGLPGSGYVGLIFARSGLGTKNISLPNGVGVIDSDYRGEIFVSLKNFGTTSYTITPNDRIAQLVILPISNLPFREVTKLENTARGEAGFGSTGA